MHERRGTRRTECRRARGAGRPSWRRRAPRSRAAGGRKTERVSSRLRGSTSRRAGRAHLEAVLGARRSVDANERGRAELDARRDVPGEIVRDVLHGAVLRREGAGRLEAQVSDGRSGVGDGCERWSESAREPRRGRKRETRGRTFPAVHGPVVLHRTLPLSVLAQVDDGRAVAVGVGRGGCGRSGRGEDEGREERGERRGRDVHGARRVAVQAEERAGCGAGHLGISPECPAGGSRAAERARRIRASVVRLLDRSCAGRALARVTGGDDVTL